VDKSVHESITQPMIVINLAKNSRQDDFMANSIYQKFLSYLREICDSFSHKVIQFAASTKQKLTQ